MTNEEVKRVIRDIGRIGETEEDRLRADLLATRLALKMAQAAWWVQREIAYSLRVPVMRGDAYDFYERVERHKMLRAVKLCRYFATKFEREAEEMVK